MTETHTESPVLLLPIAIRLALLLVVPIIELVYHKLMHTGIHHAIEKCAWLHHVGKRIKFLPDILMILALVILHFVA